MQLSSFNIYNINAEGFGSQLKEGPCLTFGQAPHPKAGKFPSLSYKTE